MAKKLTYNPNEKCKQAISFARVSSKRQKDEGVSLEVQEKTIAQYCKKNGFKILDTFSIDESSTRGSRKKFHEMLDLAETCNGKVAIVVNYVDRLQRTYTDTPILEQLRLSGKIEIHALRENLIITKDSPAMDLTVWYMHVLMANFQVNSMTDKVKESQKKLIAEGHWLGLAPIGYINAKDDEDRKATLIIDEQRAPIIKRIFEEYATGLHSLQSIWLFARAQGFISKEKNHFKNSKDFNKRTFVSRNTIHNILKNPFYYGEMWLKKQNKLVPHIYEPIISKALFDKVQTILKSKGTEVYTHEQQYKAIPFAFRGIIKCATCGCTITPERKIRPNKIYVTLKCSHLRGNCKQGNVSERVVMEQLDRELFSKLSVPTKILNMLKANVQKELDDTSALNKNIKSRLETELKNLENKEDNLTDLYADGKIREDLYNRQINAIAEERERIKEDIKKYKDVGNDVKSTMEDVLDIIGNIPYIMKKASPTKQNELLRLLITDCKLKDSTLIYTVRPPFDKFIQADSPTSWFKNPTQDLDAYTNIADEVKMVKE